MGKENKKQIIEVIKNAEKECENLDETNQNIFTAILKSLLYLIDSEEIKVDKVHIPEINNEDIPEPMKKLSNATDISADNLDHIFNIESEKLELIATFKDKSWTQKHFKTVVCILTAYHYCFGIKEIKSSELNEHLKKLNVGSLQNLSPNLQKPQFKKYITVEGEKGAQKIYKLKRLGIKKGLDLIKDLLTQEIGDQND